MSANSESVTLFWFRRDLRLDDNSGLFRALQWGGKVLPLFIFDPDILDKLEERADRRIPFISGALQEMQIRLQQAGSSLVVFHLPPLEAFRQLLTHYNVEAVFANTDYEPEALQRDRAIAALLREQGIPFFVGKDQVVFEKEEVVKPDGTPYTVFTPYAKAWKRKLTVNPIRHFASEQLLSRFLPMNPRPLPGLGELGFSDSGYRYVLPAIDRSVIINYDITRNYPAIAGTSGLSPHLRFGTVSIRRMAELAAELNETWLNELIWREFFMSVLYHFPLVTEHPFKAKYAQVAWRNQPGEFDLWCNGQTGFPMVDAGMRQLMATGVMHNRVRMVVASFLTKHLLIDWRWGEAWFARHLLDYELASNNGNWQWAAGTGCDAAPWFRIFNPMEQARKFDPENRYIQRWVPEAGTPHYPEPMVNHADARNRALQTYSAAVDPRKF